MTENLSPSGPPPRPGIDFKAVWTVGGFALRSLIVLTGFFLTLTIVHLLVTVFGGDDAASYERLRVSGEEAGVGVYDPSLAFVGEKEAFMAYAAIKGSGNDALAEIHIAATHDAGKSWSYSARPVFASRKETLYKTDGATPLAEGIVRYEVPGLLYDPEDKGKEWKIFAYRYFWNGDVDLAQKTAVIAYKTTSDPFNEWSDEAWLFSARPGIPPAPYDRLVLLPLSKLSPALADVISFSEPAPFIGGGKTYLLLTAFTATDRPTRLVLFETGDHGQSWLYRGAILKASDSGKKEITLVSGGDLVSVGKKTYLLAGFGDEKIRSYGVDVFEVSDLSKATLKRDAKTGLPVRVGRIAPLAKSPLTGMGAGGAAYHENMKGGVLISQMGMENNHPVFNIFKTFRGINEKD